MAIFNLMLLVAFPMIVFSAQSKIEGKILQQLQREFVHDDPILKVTLNYGQYETHTQKNGIFAFYNIPNGRYFLEVHSRYFVYESAFIDVYTSNKGTNVAVSKIHPISRQRPKQQQQQNKQQRIQTRDQMLFEIIQRKDYFEKEEELSLSSIYQNQYFFMIAITVLMLFFVKKMPIEELQSAERAPQQQQQQQ